MAFPQLLRHSKFASFDPSITRVYTSTPHSVNKYGDFGLKSPIDRPKGPRYIKVSKLDAGKLLGSDWRSAEPEARLMEIHGTGRTPWRSQKEWGGGLRSMGLDSSELLYGEPEAGKRNDNDDSLVHDVNTMSPKAFKQYLKDASAWRGSYLKSKLDNLAPESLEKLKFAEERTLVYLAAKRYITNYDPFSYQAAYTRYKVNEPGSKQLQSSPHPVYGMNYSRPTADQSFGNPLMFAPGRALDPAVQSARRARDNSGLRNEGTNRPWVVSVGGLTGVSSMAGGRMADDRTGAMRGVDFNRQLQDQGENMFRVSSATVAKPPSVINHPGYRHAGRPLETFKFNLGVQAVSPDFVQRVQDVGGRKYVGSDEAKQRSDMIGGLGAASIIGGPRSSRTPGAAYRSLQSRENQMAQQSSSDQTQRIQDILRQLAAKKDVRSGRDK